MPKITLNPSGKVVEVSSEKNLLELLKEKKLYLNSSCGGFGRCGDCVVKVEKGLDDLSPLSFEEKQLLGTVAHLTKERLACQITPLKDLTLEVSKHNLNEA